MKIKLFLVILSTLIFSCGRKSNPRLKDFKDFHNLPEANVFLGTYMLDSISRNYFRSMGMSDSVVHKIVITKDSLYIINLPEVFDLDAALNMRGKGYRNTSCRYSWTHYFKANYSLSPDPKCWPEDISMYALYRVMLDENGKMTIVYGHLRSNNEGEFIIYRKVD